MTRTALSPSPGASCPRRGRRDRAGAGRGHRRDPRRHRHEVPEYARPLEGSFGHGVRTGVTEALRQFVALIRDPDRGRGPGPRGVRRALGRGELREGRTLDALQSAYRVGARVAWRRLSGPRSSAGLDAAHAEAPRRVDLRLHRPALRRLGRGLRGGAFPARGRARAPAAGADRRCCCATLPPTRPSCARRRARPAWSVPRSAAALACGGGRTRPDRPPAAARIPDHAAGGHRLRGDPRPGGPGPRGAARARRARDHRRARPHRPAVQAGGARGRWPAPGSRGSSAGTVAGEGLIRADDRLVACCS